MLYSLWILVISAAFYLVKIDNLSYLFASIYDAARWPVDVFRGFLRLLFTFVIPLALLTSYPALALLGKLDLAVAAQALGGLAGSSRWRRAWSGPARSATTRRRRANRAAPVASGPASGGPDARWEDGCGDAT